MAKQNRNLTPAQTRAQRERRKSEMTIFVNGKQKRVPRAPLIDGLPVDEFIARHADPIWLHQNEMWEYIAQEEDDLPADPGASPPSAANLSGGHDVPF